MNSLRFMAVLIAGLLTFSLHASDGKWGETPAGLPYYSYEGLVQPDEDRDPAFLLGNYRLTLMTHASGIYQLMSGERVWARFNADPSRLDYGKNRSTVTIDKKSVELVGRNSLSLNPLRCSVETGIGFTRYDYRLDDGIRCSRMISIMPSEEINGGAPCFLVSVTFTNTGKGTRKISYVEAISPEYVPANGQMIPAAERSLKYPVITEVSFRCLKAMFAPSPQRFMRFPSPDARSLHEVAPQTIFLYADDAFLSINEGELKATINDFRLRAGQSRTINIVIGFSGDDDKAVAEKMIASASAGKYGAFEAYWKRSLPDFSSERDVNTRRELYWNAHMLESSAVYDSYFDETFVPSGAAETYHYGRNISNRDHLAAVLPLCYMNPDLAKSSLKYVLKHVGFDGRLYEGNEGFGCVPFVSQGENGLHNELVKVVAEYLRVTGDYAFLDERVTLYPMGDGEYLKVIEVLERCFLFSDHMSAVSLSGNAALSHFLGVIASYPELVTQLKLSGRASKEFVAAMDDCLKHAMEICASADDSFCSSAFTLDMHTSLLESSVIPASRKRDIYDYLLDDGIEEDLYDLDKSMLYPFIYGISSFDALDARAMLRKCTQFNMDETYPGSWSELSVHPYSWPLYCHYRLTE